MINQQKFGEEMNRATAMMREGNIEGAARVRGAEYLRGIGQGRTGDV